MPDVINLPPLPGLPDVELAPGAVAPPLMTADDPSALAALGAPVWGIYSNGVPVVVADTVLDVGYTKAFQVSDFPVEEGAFASYDSVELPFEGRVRFASGGSAAARQALIDSVEAVLGDLNTYDVVTPERVYINANLNREEYRRTQDAGGASLLQVEVGVQEVRILSTGATGSNTVDPASADPVNGGTVTPLSATSGAIGSDTVASVQAALNQTPVTTPLPQTLGGGVGGLPVTQPSGGIGSA